MKITKFRSRLRHLNEKTKHRLRPRRDEKTVESNDSEKKASSAN